MTTVSFFPMNSTTWPDRTILGRSGGFSGGKVILFVSAVALVKPGQMTDILGMIGVGLINVLQKRRVRRALGIGFRD